MNILPEKHQSSTLRIKDFFTLPVFGALLCTQCYLIMLAAGFPDIKAQFEIELGTPL